MDVFMVLVFIVAALLGGIALGVRISRITQEQNVKVMPAFVYLEPFKLIPGAREEDGAITFELDYALFKVANDADRGFTCWYWDWNPARDTGRWQRIGVEAFLKKLDRMVGPAQEWYAEVMKEPEPVLSTTSNGKGGNGQSNHVHNSTPNTVGQISNRDARSLMESGHLFTDAAKKSATLPKRYKWFRNAPNEWMIEEDN